MILTFAEDFTNTVELDSELIGTSDSGIYYNKGVHNTVNLNNILAFLPYQAYTFDDYDEDTYYNKFDDTNKRSDVVSYNSKIWISKISSNKGHTPGENDGYYWLETNINSLRLRSFINDSKQRVISALSLSNRLIESQFIYNVSDKVVTPSGDYIGWCFTPNYSDYVKININQISLQATTEELVNLYVINQGQLITTLKLHPDNGRLEWEELDYEISGIGTFYFVTDGIEVWSQLPYNDALRYKGFIAYPVSGTGETPQDSEYVVCDSGNGFNFDVSVYTDTSSYVDANLTHLSKLLQVQFEYDCLEMFVNNPHNQKTGTQANLNLTDYQRTLLVNEIKNIEDYTVAKRLRNEISSVKKSLARTIDKFLVNEDMSDGIDIEEGVL